MGEGKGFLKDWFWFVDGEVLPMKYRSMWECRVLWIVLIDGRKKEREKEISKSTEELEIPVKRL